MEPAKMSTQIYYPQEDLGTLFSDVQMKEVFLDSKTFVDAIPRIAPEQIVSKYLEEKDDPAFDLKIFVDIHFIHREEQKESVNQESQTQKPIQKHLKKLWKKLERKPDDSTIISSKLPLPKKYVVPGGRFDEIYYWDTYFTLLGLLVHGKRRRVKQMITNFDHLIQTYGHIPNGNRSYYLSRSQPPFFAPMILLIAKGIRKKRILKAHKNALWQEYRFWMDQSTALIPSRRRVVLEDGSILNRYYDHLNEPRPESYKEDQDLFESMPNPPSDLYRNIRAACESGWDFSSRWLPDPHQLMSIETTSIIPVDLNSLLYIHEITLAESLQICGLFEESELIRDSAEQRKKAITQHLFDPELGIFLDYHIENQSIINRPTLAMVFPLWAGIATEEQARKVILYLDNNFLKPGGLVTSTCNSGQQWDSPNGWAPLQWIAVQGAIRYGHLKFAHEVMQRWCQLTESVYQRTGKMMEKYNVVDMSLEAGGGEYPVQDGFGWTNGVYLGFKKLMKKNHKGA